MINAILVFNNHGKPRLVRFYQHLVRGRGHRWGSAGALGRPRLAGVIVVGLGSPACLSPAPRPGPSGCAVAGSPVAAPAAAPVVPGLAGSWHLPVTRSCRLTVSLGVAGGEQGMWVLQAVHPWVFALAFLQAEEVQQQIIRETFHLVLKRDDHICNFLECGSLFGGSDYKLIYRHYATLYFVFCVDSSESELGILDLIQVFVETLDKCFENVCELDLIFHMDKVHHILQEVVIGGMVLETNMNEIVAQVEAQSKLEKAEGGLSAAPSRAVSAVKNINLPEIPRNINIGDINIKVPNLSQFM
uniref:Adaptor related protein complex 3 subunit sigma 2 n=11 Tax=Neoaves TaxID=3078114 RepID=A0A8B9MJM0_9AVES